MKLLCEQGLNSLYHLIRSGCAVHKASFLLRFAKEFLCTVRLLIKTLNSIGPSLFVSLRVLCGFGGKVLSQNNFLTLQKSYNRIEKSG
jgi:hypothetical protein